MPDSYPKRRNFNSYQTTIIIDSFSCIFFLRYVLFYQFYAEISTFFIKKCLVGLLSKTSWHYAQVPHTHLGIRRKYPERVKPTENLVWYARKELLRKWRCQTLIIILCRTCQKQKFCHLYTYKFPKYHLPLCFNFDFLLSSAFCLISLQPGLPRTLLSQSETSCPQSILCTLQNICFSLHVLS